MTWALIIFFVLPNGDRQFFGVETYGSQIQCIVAQENLRKIKPVFDTDKKYTGECYAKHS